jgi:hypothetical protein
MEVTGKKPASDQEANKKSMDADQEQDKDQKDNIQ